jgi:hypothetical protein
MSALLSIYCILEPNFDSGTVVLPVNVRWDRRRSVWVRLLVYGAAASGGFRKVKKHRLDMGN